MEKILLVIVLLTSFVFATEKTAGKKVEVQHKTGSSMNGADGKNIPPQQQEVKTAPCATSQDEIMKKLEDKKKADTAAAASGKKVAGLQGLGATDTGCKVK